MDIAATQKPNLLKFVRIFVSLILIVIIVSRIDFQKWLVITKSASIPGLGLAFMLVILSLVVSARTWQIVLRSLSIHVPVRKLTTTYFVGLFCNNFLPTSIGGDVMRVYQVGKHTDRGTEATASVIVERLFGAFALGLTAVLAVLLSFNRARPFLWLILAFFLLCSSLLVVVTRKSLSELLSRKFVPDRFNLKSKAQDVLGAVHKSTQAKRSLFWVLVLSLVFQLMVVFINYIIFNSLGLSIPLVYCLIFTPLISALSMLPISVNGLGVRESGYIYFFTKVGLSMTQAVSASLIFFVLVVAASLIGGIIFSFQD